MTLEGQVEGRELPEDACSLVMLTDWMPRRHVRNGVGPRVHDTDAER